MPTEFALRVVLKITGFSLPKMASHPFGMKANQKWQIFYAFTDTLIVLRDF